jgi:hypothetical protein
MNFDPADDSDFTYDTVAQADAGLAAAVGSERPDRAWVLSDRDVWYRNPYYQGLPVPHPEDWDAALDGGYEGTYETFLTEYRANLSKPVAPPPPATTVDCDAPF